LVDEFLQSLTYEFTGPVPPTSVDVDWRFEDAGGLFDTGTTTVNFTANQLPLVDLNGFGLDGTDVSLTFIENDGLTNIAPDANIADLGENDITRLNLDAVGFSAIGDSELVLGGVSITSGIASSGTIEIDGSTIAYNYDGGDELSFTDSTGTGEPISDSSLAELVRSIQYRNLSEDPTAGSIDFRFTAEDAVGQLSETVTSTLEIVSVNDAPAGSDNNISIAEDTEHTFTAADFGFSDADGDALNRVFIDQLPDNGQLLFNGNTFEAGNFISIFDISNGNLTFQPDSDVSGNNLASFTFSVADDGGTANGGLDRDQTPQTITFDVTPVNDAPVATDDIFTIDEDGVLD